MDGGTSSERDAEKIHRREFLRRSAGVAAAFPAAVLLAACAKEANHAERGPGFLEARQDRPVTLPMVGQPIPASMPVEKGARLRIFGWHLYTKPSLVRQFEQRHGVTVDWTDFDTMDEALARLRTGDSGFDVFFPGVDTIGKLVAAGMLMPLNHDYLPNISHLWDSFQDPFYDRGSRYTVANFVWTTGIAWRSDHIPDARIMGADDPYQVFWDEHLAGHVHLLNGSREALAMALMRNGVEDVNTGDQRAIDAAKDDLLDLVDKVSPKFDHFDYRDLFRKAWLHQSWSGNIGFARFYAPDPSDMLKLRYWWPPQGGTGIPGVVGSDSMAVMSDVGSPVAAHAFIDFLLDPEVAYENAIYEGYQPPQKSFQASSLIREGIVPPNLSNIIVRQEDFLRGHQILELSPTVDELWQSAYDQVTTGF